jgi:hypothetical protein
MVERFPGFPYLDDLLGGVELEAYSSPGEFRDDVVAYLESVQVLDASSMEGRFLGRIWPGSLLGKSERRARESYAELRRFEASRMSQVGRDVSRAPFAGTPAERLGSGYPIERVVDAVRW